LGALPNIKEDIRRANLRYLLEALSLGRLDKENAPQLRQLLTEELGRINNDPARLNEVSALIRILDLYINGKIDLMLHPEAIPAIS
jgi:hypothetical protein